MESSSTRWTRWAIRIARSGTLLIALATLTLFTSSPPQRAVAQASKVPLRMRWSSAESDDTRCVVWGDYDGDGDLDVAVGNRDQPARLYRNDGGVLTTGAVWSSDEADETEGVAWGDYDGDGDLDLAVGNRGQPNRLYRNDGGVLTTSAVWSSDEADDTRSVAWGDYDGDGDLDLAVGNGPLSAGQPNRLYLNDGGVLTISAVWSSDEADKTWSVAWEDYDGDGDLDLAVGNSDQPNRLYRNDGGLLTTSAVWSSDESDYTYSVAWGDYDSDGDLDLAVGNGPFSEGQPNRLYRNDGGGLTTSAVWSSDEADKTWSLAWGDWDGDGDLDLAAGNSDQPNRSYRNDDGALTTSAVWSSDAADSTRSVAWGDYDGDGDLDLAVGNSQQPNRQYRNDGGGLTSSAVWSSDEADETQSVAWGDYDGDGDLDLAVGNRDQPNRLYRNDGGRLTTSAAWSSDEADDTRSVAWGDYDGDGDLDLAVGNRGQPNRLYCNDGGALRTSAAWSSDEADDTRSVAWGDYDGDGDLDLAVGNGPLSAGQPNRLYRNDGGMLTTSVVWSSDEADYTYSMAWGDYDSDGDLDLAVGNKDQSNQLYRNDGGALTTSAVWSSEEADNTRSVAWGDYDGDGNLDLAVGNWDQPGRLYNNDGAGLATSMVWSSDEADDTRSVAWGDYDEDGDLDLAVGNWNQPSRLYRNDGGMLTTSAVWSLNEADRTWSVAWGDYDDDGDLDLAVGNWFEENNRIYQNLRRTGVSLVDNPPYVTLTRPGRTANADFYSSAEILGALTIPITYTLYDMEGDPVGRVAAFYSLDGGGHWHTAMATSGTETTDLGTRLPEHSASGSAFPVTASSTSNPVTPESAPVDGTYRPEDSRADFSGGMANGVWPLRVTDTYPLADKGTIRSCGTSLPAGDGTHVFTWDTSASGFFGQSDNVVFRLEAYPQPVATGITDTYRYTDSTPGPYQWPYAAATTFPFRVRGTQVQVYSETVALGNQVAGALVYRLPKDQPTGGFLLADGSGIPFHTDQHGYLQGRGTIGISDTLLAMVPVHTALNYAGALAFDGGDDYVIRNPLHHAPIVETTVSFWMRSEDGTGSGTPLSYATSGEDDEFLITNYNNFAIYRGGAFVTTGITATDGTWHHIAVTWRGPDGQVKLYKDGVAAYTGTLAVGTVISPDGSLVLGQDQDAVEGGFDPQHAFEGTLDKVRIWNVARTQAQIQADMFRRLSGDEPGLVASWPFDDPDIAANGRCQDRTGSGNDGTLHGPTWIGDALGGYTVYHTSAEPTETGLDAFTVTGPGVQVLTVTAQHPLVLFDIDVSLEWDAHKDAVYLQQLEFDLKKASAYLYDFTNGQMALGHVTVHQNADDWAFSHVAVQVTNRLRPFAAIGGVVVTPTVEPNPANPDETIVYGPGQVRIGATWNRYGTPGQNLGVDWPLILAHELSHYLLYLYDVYLGLDEEGLLIPVDTCTGSAMGDVYVPDNTEFIHDTGQWDTGCASTLAARTLGRTEWETIRSWYPWLIASANPGPSRMPFDLTTVTILSPTTELDVLEDPTFYLDYQDEAVSSSEARAFLLRDGDDDPASFEYVYDLGSPAGGQNRLLARGARPGDRLCVFDRPRAQYGCEVVERADERLRLERDGSWTPLVHLSPVNSTTFGIQVGGLISDGLSLKARLYPEFGSGFTETVLSCGNGMYSGTLPLAYPSMVGHVQVWADEGAGPTETDPRLETIVGYAIGGNSGISRGSGGGISRGSGGGISRGSGGGISRGSGGGISRGSGGGSLRAGEAPLVSPDGQMILFITNEITFTEGQFYTIQAMAGLPSLPAGKVAIGQGYNLVATGFPMDTPVLTGSISFQYMGNDVLVEGKDERELAIHFWDGSGWEALRTVCNTAYNMASAPSQGPGVYALLTGVTTPAITDVTPSMATNDEETELTISGGYFLPPVAVVLVGPSATYTLPLHSVSPTSIAVVVPRGLPAREYQVVAFNLNESGGAAASPTPGTFALYRPAMARFYDFFESGAGKWERGGEWDIVVLPDGERALTDSPAGPYNSAGDYDGEAVTFTTTITSQRFSLAGCATPTLTFRHDYVIAHVGSSQDVGRVEISTSDGATWTKLASYSGGGIFGEQVRGTQDLGSLEWADVEWQEVEIDLGACGGAARLRFSLEVDRYVADKGWVIDDVMVTCGDGDAVYLPVVLREG